MAPPSIAAALRQATIDGLADVAVVARGGGSFEELYAFNTEVVVRAILGSKIPVVTALGHTSDRTVADLVADAECRTPTEAGARVVPRKSELQKALQERGRRLDLDLRRRFDLAADRLRRARADLERLSPARQLERRHLDLVQRRERLERAGRDRLSRAGRDLEARRQRLDALSPYRVLSRGYSITSDADSGAVLRSAADTAPGRRLRIRLAAGGLSAAVEEIEA
jgi:exodeoxyribonuclease VII large subunit